MEKLNIWYSKYDCLVKTKHGPSTDFLFLFWNIIFGSSKIGIFIFDVVDNTYLQR